MNNACNTRNNFFETSTGYIFLTVSNETCPLALPSCSLTPPEATASFQQLRVARSAHTLIGKWNAAIPTASIPSPHLSSFAVPAGEVNPESYKTFCHGCSSVNTICYCSFCRKYHLSCVKITARKARGAKFRYRSRCWRATATQLSELSGEHGSTDFAAWNGKCLRYNNILDRILTDVPISSAAAID